MTRSPGLSVGADVTDALGITLWEPPVPVCLRGIARPFPVMPGLSKTDEERIQNIPDIINQPNDCWYATQKIDGTSGTWALIDGEFHTASRNRGLAESDQNIYWQIAREYDFETKLVELAAKTGGPVAIQGEIFGPGIQGNPLGVDRVQVRLFNVITNGHRIRRVCWPDWALDIAVPIFSHLEFPTSLDQALEQADSLPTRIGRGTPEGIVWRRASQHPKIAVVNKAGIVDTIYPSFKVVSNRYLLKHDR